ncbi:MAG: hypothetical protein MZU79_08825 [Anaerotruncus sp.]|nr:hypothetical protein [Anaerotruncus sp.]
MALGVDRGRPTRSWGWRVPGEPGGRRGGRHRRRRPGVVQLTTMASAAGGDGPRWRRAGILEVIRRSGAPSGVDAPVQQVLAPTLIVRPDVGALALLTVAQGERRPGRAARGPI